MNKYSTSLLIFLAGIATQSVIYSASATTLTLTSSDPADNATSVTRSATPTLTFSAALNRATVSDTRIVLRSAAGTQKMGFSVVDEQLKLSPTTALLPFTHYTLDVAGVRSIDGDALAAPLTIDFTTRDGAWKTPTLIEHNAAYATDPRIAASAKGNVFVLWLQHNGSNYSAWANRYLPNIGWGQAVALEGTHEFDSFDPTIAVDKNGNALALWDRYDGTHWSVYADRYTVGAGWSGAQVITNSVASSGTIPEVAFDNNGNAIAVWAQYADDGTQSIIADRYAVGSGWSAPVVINDGDDATNQLSARIDFDAQGNAIAIWQANRNGVTLIWSNRYVAGGNWGTPQIIQSDQTTNAFSPQLDVGDNGDAIAVWEQADNVYASRYVVGSGWSAATVLSSTNGYGPQVAVNGKGDAIAVWTQVIVTNNGSEIPSTRGIIWGSRYTTGGGWEAATLLQSPNGFSADSPQITIDANGNGLAAWNQFNGSVYRIYTTRYQVNVGWSARQLIDTPATVGSFTPQLDIDGTGNVFATWEQNDGTGTQSIWANRFQ